MNIVYKAIWQYIKGLKNVNSLCPIILILIKYSKEIILNMQNDLYADIYYSSTIVKTLEITKITNNRMIKKTAHLFTHACMLSLSVSLSIHIYTHTYLM